LISVDGGNIYLSCYRPGMSGSGKLGRRKYSRPRHGSLAYLPRGRSARLLPRMKYWPQVDVGEGPLGFIAYKVGMTAVHYIDNRPNTPTTGSEVQSAATVLAAPPLRVLGVALYGLEDGRLVDIGRIWDEKVDNDIRRRNPTFRAGGRDTNVDLNDVAEVRLIVATNVKAVGAGKTPHIAEIKVGGDVKKAFEYALSKLGGEVRVGDVFKEGAFIDVLAVTKGKGFQGVVKRYGVSILQRKSRKTRRGVAAIGPWNPHYVMYTVPRSGQMGYHRRTEFNKRILIISDDISKINPASGWHKYGLVKTDYIVVEGSVPGTPKRPVFLRHGARAPAPLGKPEITMVEV
jgi:large subunit ribosomal protein L3